MTNRKLVAVLFTDIVGFSKNMSLNEERTMQLLDEHDSILTALIIRFNGHVLKHIGDAIFAEFPLVSDAVNCGREIQATLLRYNSDKKHSDQILIRIGIHMGEVIERDHDLFGDGVNIAARLEPLAIPGGICLSEDVYRAIKSSIKELPQPGGLVKLKNIPESIKIFHYVPEGMTIKQVRSDRTNSSKLTVILSLVALITLFLVFMFWPESKQDISVQQIDATVMPNTIAVLAFRNISGDPQQEYFTEGISEEILNLLAHIPSLSVTSRTSAFAFKDKSMLLSDIAKELNVKYILEGSVRQSGDTLRITAQLIDTQSDTQLWSDTYDKKVTDIFAIQDEISSSIVAELKQQMGLDLPQPKVTKNIPFEVMDQLWQGRFYIEKRTAESLAKAEQHFTAMTESAPEFAEAWAGLARATLWQGIHRYGSNDYKMTLKLAEQYANKAYQLDPNNDDVLSIKGQLTQDMGRHKEGLEYLLKAAKLNPSNADVLIWIGGYYGQTGQPQKSIEYRTRALLLNPKSSVARYVLITNLLQLGKKKEAKVLLEGFKPDSENDLQFLRAQVMYHLYTYQYGKALYFSEQGRRAHAQFIFFTGTSINIFADLADIETVKAIFDNQPSPFREIQYLHTGQINRYTAIFSAENLSQEDANIFEFDVLHALIINGRMTDALPIVQGCGCILEAFALQKLGREDEAALILQQIQNEIKADYAKGLVDFDQNYIKYLIVSKQLDEAVRLMEKQLNLGYIMSSDFYLHVHLNTIKTHADWSRLHELSQKNAEKQKAIYEQLLYQTPLHEDL